MLKQKGDDQVSVEEKLPIQRHLSICGTFVRSRNCNMQIRFLSSTLKKLLKTRKKSPNPRRMKTKRRANVNSGGKRLQPPKSQSTNSTNLRSSSADSSQMQITKSGLGWTGTFNWTEGDGRTNRLTDGCTTNVVGTDTDVTAGDDSD